MERNEIFSRLCDNLQTADRRFSLMKEQRRLCVTMLAEEICAADGTAEELFADFCQSVKDADECQKALFCRAYVKSHAHDASLAPEALFGLDELPPAGAHGKIAFVRNRYNERAYDRFSELVIGAKSLYVSDFAEACDAVYNGQCSYCILPIEDHRNGRLVSFYTLMNRYELKICATAEIDGDELGEGVRYALIGRSAPRPFFRSHACALECSLAREDGSHLSRLLAAAEELGATVQKMDFLPLEYDHSFYRTYVTFMLSAADAASFGLYLSLSYPNYTPIGFYTL